MKLTRPSKNAFWISLILAALGLVGRLESLPLISTYSWWLILVGYVLLAVACLVKGL